MSATTSDTSEWGVSYAIGVDTTGYRPVVADSRFDFKFE